MHYSAHIHYNYIMLDMMLMICSYNSLSLNNLNIHNFMMLFSCYMSLFHLNMLLDMLLMMLHNMFLILHGVSSLHILYNHSYMLMQLLNMMDSSFMIHNLHTKLYLSNYNMIYVLYYMY